MIAAPLVDAGVVMHDEVAVAGPAHVELDAVGSHGHGQRERLDRVLAAQHGMRRDGR